MYIIKWIEPGCYLREVGYWTNDRFRAKKFPNKEEAQAMLDELYSTWESKLEIHFLHPDNAVDHSIGKDMLGFPKYPEEYSHLH